MLLNREVSAENCQYPIKVIQFGEGNFLRAFADWMIYRMNRELGTEMGVAVVQPRNNQKVKELMKQDGLYTLITQGINKGEPVQVKEMIDCIQKGVNTYEDYSAFLQLAEEPRLKVMISNTTEAGIIYDDEDKLTDTPQRSFPGKLTALLYHRFLFFKGDPDKGLLHLPCELIEDNGNKLKEIILKLAQNWKLDQAFIDWVEQHNHFYNTLVDRIVPGYPEDEAESLTRELGYEDNFMVAAEWYHLWAIQGSPAIQEFFPATQLGLNVLFVDDLGPYRNRKVRILNGAHTAMVPVGYLMGFDTVRETVGHEVTGTFVWRLINEEIMSTLHMQEEELTVYVDSIIDRFKNPFIRHQLISISLNSMSKFKSRLVPVVLDYYNTEGKLPEKLCFSFASLLFFYRGKRGQDIIPLADDAEVLHMMEQLWLKWAAGVITLEYLVEQVIMMEQVGGLELNRVPGFKEKVSGYLSNIIEKDYHIVLREVLA